MLLLLQLECLVALCTIFKANSILLESFKPLLHATRHEADVTCVERRDVITSVRLRSSWPYRHFGPMKHFVKYFFVLSLLFINQSGPGQLAPHSLFLSRLRSWNFRSLVFWFLNIPAPLRVLEILEIEPLEQKRLHFTRVRTA